MTRFGYAVRVCALGAAACLMVLGGWTAPRAEAAPVLNVFKSDDMDVDPLREFLTGRYSEGFVGNPDGTGNGAHAGSWDGANLYTEWELSGPIVLPGPTIIDNRVGGTGDVIALRQFDVTNATLVLKAGGPWTGLGDGDYVVELDSYAQQVTRRYENGAPVFTHSTESFSGAFQNFAGYRLIGMANGALVGEGAPLPANYPSWVPPAAMAGSWGEVGLIEFQVTPEPASILLIGTGLGALWLARRRR